MPKPYPKEFRDDVVAVARSRPKDTTLKQVALDFGISDSCLANWLAVAEADEGRRAGTSEEITELRAAKRRIRLLEQENEVLRRAAAYLSQGNLPPK